MEIIVIKNHGPLIIESNFWESSLARQGGCYLSQNAGAFRLLLPLAMEQDIGEMRTAAEVVVSRGKWPQMRQDTAIELMFDDGTNSPYCVHLGKVQVDQFPTSDDVGKEWICTIWTRPRRGKPHKALEKPAYYREVATIPYLLPRSSR